MPIRLLGKEESKDEIVQKFGEFFEKETGIKVESINIPTGEIFARLKVKSISASILHFIIGASFRFLFCSNPFSNLGLLKI